MATEVEDFLENNFLNIVGGCCGTTPEHISAIAKIAASHSPRNSYVADYSETFKA